MSVPKTVLDQAKVLVLFAFCLLNPFAGWAYLAQVRQTESLRPPSIVDTVKPTRLALLPMIVASPGHETDVDDEWTEAFEVDFAEHDHLDVVPLAKSERSLDTERDVLALGRSVHADLVLDASAVVDEDELRVYVRLVRIADSSVRWSKLFVDERDELAHIRDQVQVAVLARI